MFVLYLKLTFKDVFEEASMVSPVQCVCIYRECVSFLLSDVKGHVRVGYLFIDVSMNWENKLREVNCVLEM